MLAPGSTISAGGITQSGTSQAAPHVAGALAILRSTYPGETLAQVQGRLTANGVGVLDSRNGLTKPRLNLLAAARPANDAFANRAVLGGSSGTYLGSSILASREAGEPTHAGVNGNASVWWKWIAPSSGQLSLDTHGSGFDTLLASYQGSALGTLNVASSNDNDGSVGFASAVLFQVQGGTEYAIAVDGVAGTSGSIALHWSLNTNAQANLAASISGPNNVSVGATTRYNVIISNAGPQTATMLRISVTLPATATIVSNPQNCTAGAAVLTCLVSSLGNGAGLTLPIDIVWSNLDTPTSIMVNVASDLPDTVTSNNSGTLQVSTAISDGDVPTLPEWGLLLLGGLLLGAMQRYRS